MAPRKGKEAASWEVDADKPKPEGETRVRRSYAVKELTTRKYLLHSPTLPTFHPSHISPSPLISPEPAPGIDTVHDIMLYAARTHGSKKAFGSREVDKIIHEDKEVTKMVNGKEEKQTKTWSYFKLKPYDWVTYEGALQLVKQIGSGLRHLGLGGEGETFFNIYASTS